MTALAHTLSDVETRLKAVEAGLAVVHQTTQIMSKEQETIRRSVAEHDEWMRKFETKLDTARDAVDTIRQEMRSSSRERLMMLGFGLFVVFLVFALLVR